MVVIFKKFRVTVVLLVVLAFVFTSMSFSQKAYAAYSNSILYWGIRGKEVKQLQEDLNYLSYDVKGIDGIFGENTYNAVSEFQRDHDLSVDGIVGSKTQKAITDILEGENTTYTLKWGDNLYGVAIKYDTTVEKLMKINGLSSYAVNAGFKLKIPWKNQEKKTEGKANKYGEMADWWTVVNQALVINKIVTVTDFDTGLSYKVVRKAGSKHADCQPLTAQDTANMKKAYGGEWSWARKAILVKVDGRVFAASQNGMPHAGQSIYDNNFPGHFCIHFLNSRTHGTDNLDPAHQSMVHKAAGLSY